MRLASSSASPISGVQMIRVTLGEGDSAIGQSKALFVPNNVAEWQHDIHFNVR